MGIYEILAYFFVYGVLGWCVEVAFAAVKEGRFVNRGFLNGPICPIYGVGVVSVIFSLQGFSESLLVLYLASAVLVTFIEWLTGYVMDRIFHQKWWDYSGQPLNIGGYVCLPFSLIWGVFCVFIVKCFQPLVAHLIGYIPHIAGIIILVVLSIAMIADLYVTASAILKLNKRLEAMEKIAAELREFSDRMGENIYENVKDGMEKEEQIKSKMADVKEAGKEKEELLKSRVADVKEVSKEKEEQLKSRVAGVKEVGKELRAEYSAGRDEWYKSQQQKLDELKGRYDSLVNGLGGVGERLVKAFPNMESRTHKDALREVKKRVAMRRNKKK